MGKVAAAGGKRILFLDIDGVVQVSSPGVISQKLLKHVKTIVERTGCSIVLSSDWRRDPAGQDSVREALLQQQMAFESCTPFSRFPNSASVSFPRSFVGLSLSPCSSIMSQALCSASRKVSVVSQFCVSSSLSFLSHTLLPQCLGTPSSQQACIHRQLPARPA